MQMPSCVRFVMLRLLKPARVTSSVVRSFPVRPRQPDLFFFPFAIIILFDGLVPARDRVAALLLRRRFNRRDDPVWAVRRVYHAKLFSFSFVLNPFGTQPAQVAKLLREADRSRARWFVGHYDNHSGVNT